MSQDKENLVEGTEVEETTLDDIFEATFGQRVDMRQARELKRMKMRHARQDAAAKVKEIQSEAKLDSVNHAELKGSHADRKDKDINNDGKSDKTDEYLHKRRKAVKHAMTKKTKSESLDLSMRNAGPMKSIFGKSSSEKKSQEEPKVKPIKLTKGWGDGGKSMKSSYGKLAKEEAEQIDEISGKTLASYSDKVARYGPMKDVRTRQKHEKGVYTAYKKMKAKDVKVPARMEEADVPFEGPYRKTGERKDEYGNTVKNVAKHLAKKAMKKQMGGLKKEEADIGESAEDKHFAKQSQKMQDAINSHLRRGKDYKTAVKHAQQHVNEEAEQIDELSPSTMGSYTKKAAADFAKRKPKMGYDGQLKKMQNRKVGVDRALKKMYGEEAEQIDEISAKTIDRYREQSHRKEYPGPKGSKKYEKRAKGSEMAFNKLTGRAKVPARMEEAEIIEARGRPRKDAQKDYTIHPKTKEKLMHNNPAHMKRIEALHRTGALQKPKVEAGQNIITQLRKASTSMRGGEKVNFNYGASTHVSAAHAQKILDKHASMRPAEKEKFQKNIGHSHAMLKKHV